MKRLLLTLLAATVWFGAQAQITIAYSENFDGPTYQGSVSSSDPVNFPAWSITNGVVKSQANALRTGPYAPGASSTGDFATYETPSFSTFGNFFIQLEFDHISRTVVFDSCMIFVSINNGVTWTQLDSNEYRTPGLYDAGSPGYFWLNNRRHFSAGAYPEWLPSVGNPFDSTEYKSEIFNISALVGNQANVKVRFVHKRAPNQGGGTNLEGWHLDNIVVKAALDEITPPDVTLNTPAVTTVYPVRNNTFVDFQVTARDLSGIDSVYLKYFKRRFTGGPVVVDSVLMGYVSGPNANAEFIYKARLDTNDICDGDTLYWTARAIDGSLSLNPGYASNYLAGATPLNTRRFIFGAPPTMTVVPVQGLQLTAASLTPFTVTAFDTSSIQSVRIFYRKSLASGNWLSANVPPGTGTNAYSINFLTSVIDLNDCDSLYYYFEATEDGCYFRKNRQPIPTSGPTSYYTLRFSGPPLIIPISAPSGTNYTLGPFNFKFNISDFSGIDTAILYYSINGGPLQDTPLVLNSISGYYEASVAAVVDSDEVCYYIVTDDNSTQCPNNTTYYPGPLPSNLNCFIARPGISFPYCDSFEGNTWTDTIGCGTIAWDRTSNFVNKPDIGAARTGSFAYVTNEAGNYTANSVSYLYSPPLNFTGINNAIMSFYRSHAMGVSAGFNVQYSIANAQSQFTTWTTLTAPGNNAVNWYGTGTVPAVTLNCTGTPTSQPGFTGSTNGQWVYSEINLLPLNNAGTVQFRFQFRAGNTTAFDDGVGIDDICFTVPDTRDIAITAVNNPSVSCQLPVGTVVTPTLNIRNFGQIAEDSIWIIRTINGLNPDTTILSGAFGAGPTPPTSLAPGSTYLTPSVGTVANSINDYTVPAGPYTLCLRAYVPGDTTASNNQICFNLYGIPTVNLAATYVENFENTSQVRTNWFSGQGGTPTGTGWSLDTSGSLKAPFGTAFSGTKAFVTDTVGNYPNNANYILYSPFFNFSQTANSRLVIRQKRDIDSTALANSDGWYIEYTTGTACNASNSTTPGTKIGTAVPTLNEENWYSVPGQRWTGTSTSGWIESVIDLTTPPFTLGTQAVRFRLVFRSDAAGTNKAGVAIDDFEIRYAAPIDGGITSVNAPVSAPPLNPLPNNFNVTVTIRNYGADTLTSVPVYIVYRNLGTTPPAINSCSSLTSGPFIWTGSLAPAQSTSFTTATTLNSCIVGTYDICAYTQIPAQFGQPADADNTNDTSQLCRSAFGIPDSSMKMLAIVNPSADDCYAPGTYLPVVRFQNTGNEPFQAPVAFTYQLRDITGGLPGTVVQNGAGSFGINPQTPYAAIVLDTLSPSLTFAANTDYQLTVIGKLPNDRDASDDTLRALYSTTSIYNVVFQTGFEATNPVNLTNFCVNEGSNANIQVVNWTSNPVQATMLGARHLNIAATSNSVAWTTPTSVANAWSPTINASYKSSLGVNVNTTGQDNIHLDFIRYSVTSTNVADSFNIGYRVLVRSSKPGYTSLTQVYSRFPSAITPQTGSQTNTTEDIDLTNFYIMGDPMYVEVQFVTRSIASNPAGTTGLNFDNYRLYNQIQRSATPHRFRFEPSILYPGQPTQVYLQVENNGINPLTRYEYRVNANGNQMTGVPGNPWVLVNPPTPAVPGGPAQQNYNTRREYLIGTFSPISGLNCFVAETDSPNADRDLSERDDTLLFCAYAIDTGTSANNMCEDFENSAQVLSRYIAVNGFTAYTDSISDKSNFSLGAPTKPGFAGAYSGNNAWFIERDSVVYQPGDSSSLVTPEFAFDGGSQCYEITFMHKYLTEYGQDGGTFEMSTDQGQSWMPVGTYNPGGANPWFNTSYVTGLWTFTPGWSGNQVNWTMAQNTISFPQATKAVFRWRFGSDQSVDDLGWAVDSFCINKLAGFCLGVEEIAANLQGIALYPNPTSTDATLEATLPAAGDFSYRIVDNAGRTILSRDLGYQTAGTQRFTIEASNLSAGYYQLVLEYNSQVLIQKLSVIR